MVNILIDIHDRAWTLNAMHSACRIVRRGGGKITLLQMIPVSHVNWLGYHDGFLDLSPAQWHDLDEFWATAEDYGVFIEIRLMHYATRREALLQAAEHFDAEIVMSRKSRGIFSRWARLRHTLFAQEFAKRNRRLCELDEFETLDCEI